MKTAGDRIPWAKPCLWGDEAEYVKDAISSSWISGGPFIEQLEAHLRHYLKIPYGVSVSNGTSAIHLAYLSLDIKGGDEVILPAYGFLAAANMTLHVGAKPVFCDVDSRSWVATAKEIVVIHTYGNVSPMDEIMDMAKGHGIAVIEDAAEAFGGKYKGRAAGTFGDIGTFSFHATKTITTGEGGFVATRRSELHDVITLYRSHGMKRKIPYWHDVPGHNFRLTNLQAAIGVSQISHLEKIQKERRRIYQTYRRECADIEGIRWQHFAKDVEPVIWTVGIQLDPSVYPQGRDAVIRELSQKGIETRPGFYTPNQHTYFSAPALPLSEQLSRHVLCLPMYIELTDPQIHTVAQTLAGLKG